MNTQSYITVESFCTAKEKAIHMLRRVAKKVGHGQAQRERECTTE